MVADIGTVKDMLAVAVELSADTTGRSLSAIKGRWGKGGGLQKYAKKQAGSGVYAAKRKNMSENLHMKYPG